MSQSLCAKCGAELISGTSYCRQCGQLARESDAGSEQVTAILGESKDAATTQRLDPRHTGPGYDPGSDSLTATSTSPTKSKYSLPTLITACVLVALLLVVSGGVFWSLRSGRLNTSANQISRSLVYPGSRTIMDMSDSGGAVLQLETPDGLEKVSDWYAVNFKPAKTMRPNSTSVIQKKQLVTVTLLSENNLTSIVIKQNR